MTSRSAEETRAAGRDLARGLTAGDVVLLEGPLGSGKTTFVQGIAEGLGARALATSPSFVIVNEYGLGRRKEAAGVPSPSALRHIDLYRLPLPRAESRGDPTVDLDRIGLPELLNDPEAITVVEWADRLPRTLLPSRRRVRVRLLHQASAESRDIEVLSEGSAAAFVLLALGVLVIGSLLVFGRPSGMRPVPREEATPVLGLPAADVSPVSDGLQVTATGLDVPWALAFAPDGALYATERPGRLVRIRDGKSEVVATLSDVSQRAESGLLGIALDSQFSDNGLLYLYYTATEEGNRVVRYRLTDGGLTEAMVLLDRIPAAPFHDGGRIAFGPDGYLYVTTGDATQPELAQRVDSLAGKILRIRSDGSVPDDNPFPGSPVYSLGHRNPQGLAWDAGGVLYATEHGPSGPGAACCHDEVNRIEAGKNYGWSHFAGTASRGLRSETAGRSVEEFVPPLAESGPTETWAPAGAAVVGDSLFFGGLRGEALFALDLKNPTTVVKHFAEEFGRIRDVIHGPDGALYVTTSNRDGRGKPRPVDDLVLRVDPRKLR